MSRFKIFYLPLFLFLSLFACSCHADENLPGDVVSSIEKRIDSGINPSIAIGVVDQNGTRFYNYGKTQEGGKPVDQHTIYEIGSITKVFTAILLAEKVLDGTVSLDDPINEYLPERAQIPVSGTKEITLGNLSDHTSGLPRMPGNFHPADPRNPFADYTVEQLYSFISGHKPTREPGSEYEYSNLAQGLLGHILTLICGLDYETMMIENIASPLGMKETKITTDKNMKDHLAIGHSNGEEVENWDIPSLAGAGAIRSSTFDMVKFLSANLEYMDTPLQAAMQLTQKVRHDKGPGGMRVGLAWHIKNGAEGDVIWHNGGTGGYRAFAGFVKESGKGVVVLTNSNISVDDIGFHLLDPDFKLKEIHSKADAVDVPEEILKSYVGEYELNPGFDIAITREGNRLFGQATGQPKFEMFAKNDSAFFLVAVDAQITFQVNVDEVKSLTLFQNGQQITGKKIN